MPIETRAVQNQMSKALDDLLRAFSDHLAGLINSKAPIASGTLSGSYVPINSGYDASAGAYVASVGSPLHQSYGQYVEHGTKPHWMPIEPLIRWVREKFQVKSVRISLKVGQKRARVTGSTRFKEREIISIAHAIQAKIAAKGTREQRFVRSAIEEMGVPYTEVKTTTEIYYNLDLGRWLQDNGFWQKAGFA